MNKETTKFKNCTKCDQKKPLEQFSKKWDTKDGHMSSCKQCQKIIKTKYYKENIEKLIEKRRIYYLKNRTKILKRQSAQAKATRKQRTAYERNRINKDLNFKLTRRLRSRLSIALTRHIKKGSAVSDLGCDINYLKTHLEIFFQPGMTWDNYGRDGWHIDHVYPLSKIELTDKFSFDLANHYSNLRPIWAQDNYKKNNKII